MSQKADKIRQIRITKLSDCDKVFDVKEFTTPAERWDIMYQLSLDVCALRGIPVSEPGTTRHIARVFKRK